MNRPPEEGIRILIAGTGGQGAITAAGLLTGFFAGRGRDVVSGQLHGMAQRGGAVQSTVMIDCGASPAIGRGGADIVLGLEPVETARALPFVSSRTVVFMNTAPVIPFVISQQYARGDKDARYPDIGGLAEAVDAAAGRLVVLDATEIARAAGSTRALNAVLLGCVFGAGLLPATPEEFMDSAMKNVPAKLADVNNRAFLSGVEFGSRVSGSG